MNWPPLNFLSSSGTEAGVILPLTLFVLAVSVAVVVIIAGILSLAVRRRPFASETAPDSVAVSRTKGGTRLIAIGLGISMALLLPTLGWTMVALGQISHAPRRPDVEIDLTAHQWWWQADYNGAAPYQRFATANELHIPVGANVLVRLRGSDVIHSFWVPQLGGKTDMIPGQVNLAWLKADRPGRFTGQCSEYCGLEHAHMGLEVVAETPKQFESWRRAQLQTAPPPASPAQARGFALAEYRCGMCHAIRGTSAGSHFGPDLTHLQSRRMLAANTLPNALPSLSAWIEDPQGIKPGAQMPPQHLSGSELNDLTSYLETLR